jgi:acyl dehydratase
VNPELVGRRFALAEPYLVGREHVRAFAAAVFATNPIHVDVAKAREAGYADVVAPTTYPAVLQDRGLQLLLADPAADFELKNVVHADESFTYVRPIVAGDELTAELEVTNVRAVRGNSMLQATTVITDAEGSEVVTAYATLVVGGQEDDR